MLPADRRREQEALQWALHIEDPTFADWAGHAAWLETDPLNAEAFDDAALLIERASAGLAPAGAPPVTEVASNDNLAVPVPPRRYGGRVKAAFGFMAAAALVGMVALPSLLPLARPGYAIETAPGQRRTITLAGGTRIALNGGTLIRLERDDPRTATLARGEAFFSVTHDAAHPFAVKSGAVTFQDVGTAFDVVRRADTTEMSVREGAVMVDPAGAAIRLKGGQSIRLAADTATVRPVDAATVGQWLNGRLSYDDASLSTVAQDIARSIGSPVSVDRAVENRHFTGVIIIQADRATMFRRVAAITGVAIRQEGAGWRMVSPAR